ncbi:MAG: glycine--tRNA ligase subunit beta [Deltaproteobacteria bacterium]|nr:glycine--tRNA ligase subunit beta [Deltaproteobacteria bacterium]
MSGELLLEIGTEEIPARFLSPALAGLKERIGSELAVHRISFDTIVTMGTPRRLGLCVTGMSEKQEDTEVESVGPPVNAAFDSQGNPTKAAHGFATRHGVSVSDLETVETKKGTYIRIKKKIEGRESIDLLPDILVKGITAVPFPKSMRWGNSEIRFARPIQWMVALFNGKVIPFKLEDTATSNFSRGHRFLHNVPFPVQDYQSYVRLAEEHYVIPDIEKRKEIIKQNARKLAQEVNGTLLEDEELLDTVANLVEYPVTLRGNFSHEYLTLPRDVLICSMKEHQKYFAVADSAGGLLPYFVVVSNNKTPDAQVVIKGNERVLSARLADARFFFDEDRKVSLAHRVDNLKQVVYQARLGSMFDKVSRMQKLATSLANEVDGDRDTVQRASYLCKADLLTEMVGEFPSLQGSVGRDYALLEGESPEVATALCEHYLPTSGKGKLPASLSSSIVSIADKTDAIVGCFGIGLIPTGVADPHALRRQALGIINIVVEQSLHIDLPALIKESILLFDGRLTRDPDDVHDDVVEFIRTRFHHLLTSRECDYDVIDAVTTAKFTDIMDAYERIMSLQEAKKQPDFQKLATTFKRVANITASSPLETIDPSLLQEQAEKDLYDTYQGVAAEVRRLVDCRDYSSALEHCAILKPSVDRFFDEVLVMCDDQDTRRNRLSLLTNISALFRNIADFSKMVTEG